jgi:hypothetical protein
LQSDSLLGGGKHAARKLKRAQILLAADAGASDEELARSIGVGGSTVYHDARDRKASAQARGSGNRNNPGTAAASAQDRAGARAGAARASVLHTLVVQIESGRADLTELINTGFSEHTASELVGLIRSAHQTHDRSFQ